MVKSYEALVGEQDCSLRQAQAWRKHDRFLQAPTEPTEQLYEYISLARKAVGPDSHIVSSVNDTAEHFRNQKCIVHDVSVSV